MKFTGALSTVLVVLPFLVLQTSAAPSVALGARQRGGEGQGQRGQGAQAKGGNAGKGGVRGGANNAKGAAAGAGAAGAAAGAAGAAGAGAANDTANAGGAAAAANGTANAGGAAAAAAGGDPQTSLTLDPSVICKNCAEDGQAQAEAGQAASATSTNNFINFCVGKTITDGTQNVAGSCNPIPMGNIPAKTAQPACKFTNPKNGDNIAENTAFVITMKIQNLKTGTFTNPNTNYFAAPQDLDENGQIIGHSHVTVQATDSVTSTAILDPTKFAFFLGLNAAAENGVLTANVAKGLPAGTYKLSSINTSGNHVPVAVPVAQHGSLDDVVYFTIGAAAKAAGAAAFGGAAGAADAAGAAGNATAADAGAANATAANGAGAGAAAGAGTAAAAAAAAKGKGGKGAANAAGAGAGVANAKGGKGANNAAGAGAGAGAGSGAGANNAAAGAGKGANNAAAGAGKGANNAADGAAGAGKGGAGARGRRSFNISRQN